MGIYALNPEFMKDDLIGINCHWAYKNDRLDQ